MHLEKLSRTDHAQLRVNIDRAQAEAATVHFVPIVASEIRRAALVFPIFFTKHFETGQFYPAALMGIKPGENLFWDGQRIDADYIPLNLQRLPFFVGGEAVEAGAVMIDLDNPGVGHQDGFPIVEANGANSPYFERVLQILGEMAGQQAPTRALVEWIVENDLLREVKLDIALENGEQAIVEGLYAIDEADFERCVAKAAGFVDLLTIASLVLSIDHVAGLVRRQNEQDRRLAALHQPNSLSS